MRRAIIVLLLVLMLPGSVSTGLTAGGPAHAVTASDKIEFQPQYIILGQLQQQAVVQSRLPRSVPHPSGFQFSAAYYTPQELQGAYDVRPLLDQKFGGSGKNVAIITVYGDPEIHQDISLYDQKFGLPPANLSLVPVGLYHPEDGIGSGWDTETALDVEAVHSMAPSAHIDLVVAENASNAIFQAIKMVVTRHLGDVVSMSFGLPENLFGESGFSAGGFLNYPFPEYYFASGASQGISFFGASGDVGAFGGTPTIYGAATYPSSSPFVTSVGGTTLIANITSGYLAAQNATTTYGYENAWSISPQYPGQTVSSGGGYSSLFPRPAYQSAVTKNGMRSTPDLSLDGNPYSGMIVVAEGVELVIGGTSLATPLLAGITADIDQYSSRNVGPVNPLIYQVYQNQTLFPGVIHHVHLGYNGQYTSGPDYNLVTGVGSPDAMALAKAAKGMKAPSLQITVSTSSGIGTRPYPQYSYGANVRIAASVKNLLGGGVSTGSFVAQIYNDRGLLQSVPLTFNGTQWTGGYQVAKGTRPNLWRIDVSGTSGGLAGYGSTVTDVGASIAIVSPIPYPTGAAIAPGTQFIIETTVSGEDGTPVTNASLVAHFIKDGKEMFSAGLTSTGTPGVYEDSPAFPASMPQGAYLMFVNDSRLGSAYTYQYFGEAILNAAILTPVDQGIPSASPGQRVVLLAQPETADLKGTFTSNVTAFIRDLSGHLAASVMLAPAPGTVQFGIYNFFRFQQANFTIPQNFTSGFYRVDFVSHYSQGGPPQSGNYTTGFYVSNGMSRYLATVPTEAVEGGELLLKVRITDAQGKAVTQGTYTATVEPVELKFEELLVGLYSGVPLQYDPALGIWKGAYRIPSVLEGSIYQGSSAATLAGQWTVTVSGETSQAVNLLSSYTYFTVLPYTLLRTNYVTGTNAESLGFTLSNGTTYGLAGAASDNLTVRGLSVDFVGDRFGVLTLIDSKVTIEASQLSSMTASNSTVVVRMSTIANSQVGIAATNSRVTVLSSILRDLDYAFDPVNSDVSVNSTSFENVLNLSRVAAPSFALTSGSNLMDAVSRVNLTVSGKYLKLVSVTLDGVPAQFSEMTRGETIAVSLLFSSSNEPDGLHTIGVTASNGLSYVRTFVVNNTYHRAQDIALINELSARVVSLQSSTSNLKSDLYLVAAAAAVVIVLFVAAASVRKRGRYYLGV